MVIDHRRVVITPFMWLSRDGGYCPIFLMSGGYCPPDGLILAFFLTSGVYCPPSGGYCSPSGGYYPLYVAQLVWTVVIVPFASCRVVIVHRRVVISFFL